MSKNQTEKSSVVLTAERLDATQSLEVNLLHLANNPKVAIEAFGYEWAGMTAASAYAALTAKVTP